MTLTQKTKNRILKLESEDLDERKEAISQLSSKENKGLETLLISCLKKNTSENFREGACKILGEIGTEDSADVLISCLDDYYEGVQFHAAVALGKMGNARAVDSLIAKLVKGVDPSLKGEAVIALGKIGDKKAVRPLLKVLQNDPDIFVRRNAAKSLELIGDTSAIRPLQKLANRTNNSQLDYLILMAIQNIRGKK